jgi:hypothetical protein
LSDAIDASDASRDIIEDFSDALKEESDANSNRASQVPLKTPRGCYALLRGGRVSWEDAKESLSE